MKRLILILIVFLFYKSTINADIFNDIWEMFYVYAPEDLEHHKKQGIQTICLYDCMNDSLIEGLSFGEKWDCTLDSIGVYSVSLATESHGIEFILFKINEDYMVFHNIEPHRVRILRELLSISEQHPDVFTAKAVLNILNNIINPIGLWIGRQ